MSTRHNLNNTSTSLPGVQLQELAILLQNSGCADLTAVIQTARISYVDAKHHRAISHMINASGYKQGKWKTYVYLNGKRKEIIASSKEEIYERLYAFYYGQENPVTTLAAAFDSYIAYKKNTLACAPSTIRENSRLFKRVSDDLKAAPMNAITDDDIRFWLVSEYLAHKPTARDCKKMLQLLNQLFKFAILKKKCIENPMNYIDCNMYLKDCKLDQRSDEEKAYSPEEVQQIIDSAMRDSDNPRAQMTVLAAETGLRIAELAALHKCDVKDGFIHVHRQQRKDYDSDGHLVFTELPYTKNERRNPRNGRFIPLTKTASDVIACALKTDPSCEYLFSEHGKWITKDSYAQNLKRRCKSLGIKTTNNHAFRMAFNSRLIALGLSASDRALLLGHEVQTNEACYSLTDNRKLQLLKRAICNSSQEDIKEI